MIYRVLFLGLICCTNRYDSEAVSQKLQLIIGEPVTCFQVYTNEGFLCKSNSGKNYYCPFNSNNECFYTPRLKLEEPPVESTTAK